MQPKRRLSVLLLPVAVAVAMLSGCKKEDIKPFPVNLVTDLELQFLHPPIGCTANDHGQTRGDCSESKRFAIRNREFALVPKGLGTCRMLSVDFGDGTIEQHALNVSLDGTREMRHTYTGWGGVKRITIKGESGCSGIVTRDIHIAYSDDGHENHILAFQPNNSVCNRYPMPDLRKGAVVRIVANDGEITYGIPKFNASGDLHGTAPPDFPFKDLRPFSIIYQIGGLQLQGEVGSVIFRVPAAAPLEICVNDHKDWLFDNRGAIRFDVTVNETQAE